MVEFYLRTFPRFPLRKKEHKSYFGKNRTHDFRTSRCAGYLLDNSGDEYPLMGDKKLRGGVGGGIHERSRVFVIIMVFARAASKQEDVRLALSCQAFARLLLADL